MLAYLKPALVTLGVIGAVILVLKDPLKPEYRPRIVTELSPDFYVRKAALEKQILGSWIADLKQPLPAVSRPLVPVAVNGAPTALVGESSSTRAPASYKSIQ